MYKWHLKIQKCQYFETITQCQVLQDASATAFQHCVHRHFIMIVTKNINTDTDVIFSFQIVGHAQMRNYFLQFVLEIMVS